jgi:hypothetical protein
MTQHASSFDDPLVATTSAHSNWNSLSYSKSQDTAFMQSTDNDQHDEDVMMAVHALGSLRHRAVPPPTLHLESPSYSGETFLLQSKLIKIPVSLILQYLTQQLPHSPHLPPFPQPRQAQLRPSRSSHLMRIATKPSCQEWQSYLSSTLHSEPTISVKPTLV